MNLVYNCDDNYIQHAAVSIASAFQANQGTDLHVWILGMNISAENTERIGQLAERSGQQITVLPLTGFEERVREMAGGSFDAGRFTTAALARIFAPSFLPAEVQRYIYLDCDTLVRRPLTPLWETELAGNAAALVPEPTIYQEVRDIIGLNAQEPYFNSGVILADCRIWKKEEITARCMDFYRECGGRLPFSDQDLLNYALRGRIRVLSPCWNFFTNYYYEHYRGLTAIAPWYASCVTEQAFYEAKQDPCILHFAGDERPWIAGNLSPARKEYRCFLERTPWRGTPLLPGKRAYMLAYHMMNWLTLVCPAARRAISKAYYAHSTDTT